jgi:hypothetical protein
MNHKITQHLPQTIAPVKPGAAPSKRLSVLFLALCTLAGTGCFRATGLQRSPMVAEVLPESGGDKVIGLKCKGGAGNLYLGNDFVHVAIDNAVYGDTVQLPMAGALSGGSIIDAGYIFLDASYTRVNMPGNAMNRLTPVVNQDPAQQIVFTSYSLNNTGNLASIIMTGSIPGYPGVTVTHTLSLAQLDRFITMSTTVTNTSGVAVAIQSVGDSLVQQGGGYAFNVPAAFDYQGNALPSANPPQWGVQIPGTAYSVPASVRSPMVGLMDLEPGADTMDSHCSVGILPVDADQLLVACDSQDLLDIAGNLRPQPPTNLIAGSLATGASLAPNGSITYNRRLFLLGGQSVATNLVGGMSIAAAYPNSSNGLFNLMDTYRYNDLTIRPVQDFGQVSFNLSGMSQRQGPVPTEIRIERNVTALPGSTTSPNDVWQLQRVEWFEPNENLVTQAGLAPSLLQSRLPVGTYRMVLHSKDQGVDQVQTRTLFQNLNVVASPTGANQAGILTPLWIQKDQDFGVDAQDVLSPSAAPDPVPGTPNNMAGQIQTYPYTLHYFLTRETNAPAGSLQPLRITFLGTNGTPNPLMRRMRTLASYFDPINKVPQVAAGIIPGQYQFRGGNEMFGTGFTKFLPTQFAWFPDGDYTAYGSRGPLSQLVTLDLTAYNGQTDINHTLSVTPMGLPPNWTSFDVPGPGQATTGGYLPGEKLASAIANGVQVVGHTEQDIQVDPLALYTDFRYEYNSDALTSYNIPASLSAINRPPTLPFGLDPFVVGGRTSVLAGYGAVTALFTPEPSNAPLGGVLLSSPNQPWILADFLAQGQGQFNVVHRPRAPQPQGPDDDPAGLFTLQGAPQPLVSGNWWNQPGLASAGLTNGSFDALELLRGASLANMTASAWFAEFLAVRGDWFNLLNQQGPTRFTKAMGLSSAKFSIDTPVGLARTYVKASLDFLNGHPNVGDDVSALLTGLQSGAAVASTGPFLDVSVSGAGPGQLVPGPVENVTLVVNLWKSDWMPVDQVRVIVNGNLALTVPASALILSTADSRLFSGSFTLPLAQLTGGQDGWIVVEAGVPLAGPDTTQPLWTVWNAIMRGIYPIAVTNPIFVDVNGNGYVPPASIPAP